MNVDIVVDVGNSRMKWGRCCQGQVAEATALNSRDAADWQRQIDAWSLGAGLRWVVTGVDPQGVQLLLGWLRQREQQVLHLSSWRQLPLKVAVDFPDQVGIDRLLNAVAAKARIDLSRSALIIDAGSAVTVDWLDGKGTFRGGAIFPGFRLMAQALHDYTALLPLVPPPQQCPARLPGTATATAIEAGVFWAVAGGIRALISELVRTGGHTDPGIFLTGGDAPLLEPALNLKTCCWPWMTLEGIRMAGEGIQ
jgi:type III pantothenate kinase